MSSGFLQENFISDSYPLPIAFSWSLLDSMWEPRDRYREQLRHTENMLAFLGSVSLVLLDKQDYKEAKINPKRFWRGGITLGGWNSILQGSTKVFRKYEHPLASAIHKLNIDSPEESSFGADVAALISARNDYHHGRGPTIEEDIVQASNEAHKRLQRCMEALSFLTEYPIWLVQDFDVHRHSDDFSLKCLRLMGDGPGFSQEKMVFPKALARGDLFLDLKNQNWVPLYPFVVAANCPRCRHRETYFIDRWDASEGMTLIKSFERGHTEERKDVSASLEALTSEQGRTVSEDVGERERRSCVNCGYSLPVGTGSCPNCRASQDSAVAETPTQAPPEPVSTSASAPPSQDPETKGLGGLVGRVPKRTTGLLALLLLVVIVGVIGALIGGESTAPPPAKQVSEDPPVEKKQQPVQKKQEASSSGEAPAPIDLSGDGQTATEVFDLESGIAIFRTTYQGERNFIVKLLDENGESVGGSVANETGPSDASHAVQVKTTGQHLLDVQASGPWTITIEQPRPSSAPETTSFGGNGKTITDFFQLPGGLTRFNLAHQGSRNFIVELLDRNGARVGGLANARGSFEGSKAVRVPEDGIYVLQVKADGPWTIQVE